MYSRLPQLPPSLLQFNSFLVVGEDKASEGSSSGLVQPPLFSVNNTVMTFFIINSSIEHVSYSEREKKNINNPRYNTTGSDLYHIAAYHNITIILIMILIIIIIITTIIIVII